jgi:hypothetical protein
MLLVVLNAVDRKWQPPYTTHGLLLCRRTPFVSCRKAGAMTLSTSVLQSLRADEVAGPALLSHTPNDVTLYKVLSEEHGRDSMLVIVDASRDTTSHSWGRTWRHRTIEFAIFDFDISMMKLLVTR